MELSSHMVVANALVNFLLKLLECDAIINGCSFCTLINSEGLVECNSCHPGLYLFQNDTFITS